MELELDNIIKLYLSWFTYNMKCHRSKERISRLLSTHESNYAYSVFSGLHAHLETRRDISQKQQVYDIVWKHFKAYISDTLDHTLKHAFNHTFWFHEFKTILLTELHPDLPHTWRMVERYLRQSKNVSVLMCLQYENQEISKIIISRFLPTYDNRYACVCFVCGRTRSSWNEQRHHQ